MGLRTYFRISRRHATVPVALRCDTLRPVCTQCLTRASFDDPCDYGDGGGPSVAEALEQNISRLEARIRELELAEAPDAVRLHQSQSSSAGTSAQRTASSSGTLPVSDDSPLEIRKSLPFNPPSQILLEAVGILSTKHPNKILHAIQAEVLLATWFLHSNRILEGKYHLGTAVSLTASAGLHRIRSPRPSQTPTHQMSLPPPADSVEEGERIIAFWTVFALSNIWDTISGPTSSCLVFNGDGKGIDTPWAWEMHEYEQYTLPENLVGGSTVHNFLVGAPDSAREGLSMISMFAKASVLFSKAKRFADSVPRAQLTQAQSMQIRASHEYLDNLIDKFTSSLAPIPQEAQISSPAGHLMTPEGFPIGNPIFGALWFGGGKVFIEELRRLRSLRRSSLATRANELFAMLERLKATMAAVGQSSPFVADQLGKLTEAQ
ncbi:hypothetical protein MPER_12481 [Moniliophthora perniciosa FA553]|nr:hypothetical protein MPER_12481 [Moniliophthora perniciosa FA553]